MTTTRTCSIAGCGRRHLAKGFCGRHYQRVWKHGDVARVRETTPAASRFWSHVERHDGCWLWTGFVDRGTGYGKFNADGETPVQAHRFAYALVNGEIPPGLYVCHRCDNRRCVNPAHLFLGTAKDNMRDASAKGRIARGSRQGRARLHVADVFEIRASRLSDSRLAARFGVSRSAVYYARSGRSWAWLKGENP